MRPGGKAILTMPSSLGFGDQGKSIIPPKATIVFEIELVANLGPAAAAAAPAEAEVAEPEDEYPDDNGTDDGMY